MTFIVVNIIGESTGENKKGKNLSFLYTRLAAAIVLLTLDELMTPDNVITKLRQLRGQQALYTIKVCS